MPFVIAAIIQKIYESKETQSTCICKGLDRNLFRHLHHCREWNLDLF